MNPLFVLAPSFAAVAFVYGSIGMGGGTAYLAVMALVGVDWRVMPTLALCLNLVVAGGGSFHFTRAGHLRRELLVPLVAASIPASFLAARIPVGREAFQTMLGVLLFVAGIRLLASRWIPLAAGDRTSRPVPGAVGLAAVGALLGAVAGLTGIGGGIYLTPVLLLARWASAKEAAAISALFIVLNSTAGLAGRLSVGADLPLDLLVPLAVVVLVFGQLGAWLGASRYPATAIQALFGAVVTGVAVRLLAG